MFIYAHDTLIIYQEDKRGASIALSLNYYFTNEMLVKML